VAAALANGDGEDLDDVLAAIAEQVPLLLDADTPGHVRTVAREALAVASQRWLQAGRVDVGVDRYCFHWALELPEVWRRGGFDAVIGNPPFQGGKKISPALGASYREHLVLWLAERRRGNADLIAYFALRAAAMLRDGGMAGLLATNTIAQGDTREVGLDHLLAGACRLARAVPSEPWPGGANLEVAHLWLHRGAWRGQVVLDGRPVTAITASLEAASRVAGNAARLAANAGRSFQGSIALGMGFVLTPDAAAALIERDPRNAEVVRPYLNGEDLNSRPDCSPSRWVIHFGERSAAEAQAYPDCWEIIERLVKPERQTKDAAKYPRMVHEWWKFWNGRPGLRRAIAPLDRVIVIAQVSKTVMPVRVPASIVFMHKLVVFAYADDAHLGLLSSGVHYWWTIANSATMRADLSYSPTDCFEKLPQPDLGLDITSPGSALTAHRSTLMLDRQEGLTKTYNRVHDPAQSDADVARLRELHVALDYAVRDAYGWTDLDLGHDFHETRQGIRYTFEPIARQEILDRLLELNHERRTAEEAAGLHAKKKPARKPVATPSASQATIFDGG
ncbi:MAG: type IIL restriction-modification enzyme MmeI, partial [Candidatus Limnocylindria bacterium]